MQQIQEVILNNTEASAILSVQSVQSLWSEYGGIKRYFLEGGKYKSVIVKHIQFPAKPHHPKGWSTPLSHQRKLKSYQVECQWYRHYSQYTNEHSKIPQCHQIIEEESELLLLMEDLDASGYSIRPDIESVNLIHVKTCLSWLAHFHATFMGTEPEGLWPTGSYWHLDTRPDELARMENITLKNAAKQIDDRLKNALFQTLVHGDAKLANFCFSNEVSVAAVDFQYIGKGCGMKDVAYFISSCFDEAQCETYEDELLNHYFNQLQISLDKNIDFQLVKKEWMGLYKYAWADFYRFLDGWNPGHWKMHGYSERLAQEVLDEVSIK
ncbi:Ecdysteroid kinase [Ekhidna lutea]|uniref:Ecdysteroid kinase n=1 Tax=Ekhidna lutea TaxID=447679 RepID=A0A239GZW0_EKHLU|nr:phosphotransferase [Ekhidna lutea]SNS74328.1 Ecdysteroid kinase [Ekhidna lutea]